MVVCAVEEAVIALPCDLLQHELEVQQTLTISPKNGLPVTVVQRA